MEIQKEYRVFRDNNGFDIRGYGVTFSVKNDNGQGEYFFNVKHLYKPNMRWIHVENLLSEEYLDENKIDYTITRDKGLIPLGLVDFNSQDGELRLNIYAENLKALDVFEDVIRNIEEAIKLRYKSYKFKNMIVNKVRLNEVDKIILD